MSSRTILWTAKTLIVSLRQLSPGPVLTATISSALEQYAPPPGLLMLMRSEQAQQRRFERRHDKERVQRRRS